MYIKVGQYELNTSEQFANEKEAVKRFLENFPDANPEKVKDKVKPYFKKDANKPSNTQKENSDSDGQYAKADSGVVGDKQPRKDK